MAANAAAIAIDNSMGDHPVNETSHVANPSNNPDKFADPSGEKMKALAWMGKNKVEIVEAHKPKVVDNRDVVLKVTGSTVCGSDLHLYHGAIIELEKGDILGHECMGIVESVGPGIKDLKAGDRVVASFNIGCGDCFMCKKGLSSACSTTNPSSLMQTMYGGRSCGMLGYSHFTGGFAGGQAEYVRIPNGDVNLLKIPESVKDEDALYLSDILVTSFHQVEDSGVKEGDIVGIWGVGAIGLFCVQWCVLKNAKRIIVIDNVQWRLDYAKEKFPQIETINFDEVKDIPGKIQEITTDTNGSRPPGLDVALECAAGEYAKTLLHKVEYAVGLETDSSDILNEMIKSTISFGTIGITGVYAGFTNHFNIGSVMQRGIRFIGNGQAPVHMHWKNILENYLIPGKVSPSNLIVTHRIDLDDVPKCYKMFDDKEGGIVKTFVTTKFSGPPSSGTVPLTQL